MKGWPPSIGVKYISEYNWDSAVSKVSKDWVLQSSSNDRHQQSLDKIHIKSIQDPSHVAYGQHGLFAKKTISPKTLILNYIGVVVPEGLESVDSDYTLLFVRPDQREVFTDQSLVIDAKLMGNEGRFVNDYRGIKDCPNACFETYRDAKGIYRMGIWSLGKCIRKGEEILVSYGKGFWSNRINSP